MSDKKPLLPIELNAGFISAAINIVSGEPIGLQAHVIPFALHDVPLDEEFNPHLGYPKFDEGECGVVAYTKPCMLETLYAAETLQDPGTDAARPAFEILTPLLSYDEGIPLVINAHLLDGAAVHRSAKDHASARPYRLKAQKLEGQSLYMAMPAHLPQSLIRTGDGRFFLSSDKPETLIEQLEETMTHRLSRYIDDSLEL